MPGEAQCAQRGGHDVSRETRATEVEGIKRGRPGRSQTECSMRTLRKRWEKDIPGCFSGLVSSVLSPRPVTTLGSYGIPKGALSFERRDLCVTVCADHTHRVRHMGA